MENNIPDKKWEKCAKLPEPMLVEQFMGLSGKDTQCTTGDIAEQLQKRTAVLGETLNQVTCQSIIAKAVDTRRLWAMNRLKLPGPDDAWSYICNYAEGRQCQEIFMKPENESKEVLKLWPRPELQVKPLHCMLCGAVCNIISAHTAQAKVQFACSGDGCDYRIQKRVEWTRCVGTPGLRGDWVVHKKETDDKELHTK